MRRLILVAGLALLLPAAASADQIQDFALFAGNNVFIPHASNIAGSVGSNGSVCFVQSGGSVTTVQGNIKAAGTQSTGLGCGNPGPVVYLDPNFARVGGDIVANGDVFLGAGSIVTGTVTSPSHSGPGIAGGFITNAQPITPPLAVIPAASVGAAGATNVTGPGLVLPGAYNLLNSDRNDLTFTTGTYTFAGTGVSGNNPNHATWTMDVSGGPIFVNFTGDVRIGDSITVNVVGGSPSQVQWQTLGDWLLVGNSHFAGIIFASGIDGDIHLGHENTLTGQAWATDNITGTQHVVVVGPAVIPEPSALLLLGTGLVGLGAAVRRRKR